MKNKAGFGDLKTSEDDFDEYIGEWVMITHGYSNFSAGFVKNISESGVLKLSPYEGTIYDSDWGPMRKIICSKKEEPVNIYQIGKIHKTDLANLERRVRHLNNEQVKSILIKDSSLPQSNK